MPKIKFRIKNFNCQACLELSKSMIGKIKGVKKVDVKNIRGETEVEAIREISLEEIQKALLGTNYKVVKLKD